MREEIRGDKRRRGQGEGCWNDNKGDARGGGGGELFCWQRGRGRRWWRGRDGAKVDGAGVDGDDGMGKEEQRLNESQTGAGGEGNANSSNGKIIVTTERGVKRKENSSWTRVGRRKVMVRAFTGDGHQWRRLVCKRGRDLKSDV